VTRTIAVALHDVEPATFERCALIRDWLSDHGVDRVTLLVIPAPDLHPFDDRRPELAAWLDERAHDGDAVAQHGFRHRRLRPAPKGRGLVTKLQGGTAAEFVGLDAGETRRAVLAGRRVLRLAGIETRGFVAPAYAYTPPLHEALAATFEWWASLGRLYRPASAPTRATPLSLGSSSRLKVWCSPPLVRAGAALSGELLRLDMHPADIDHRRHVAALEHVLRRARRRTAVTYDDLAAG
jgi:predicted deacetylase